jgi:hypothetical protein
MGVTKISQLPSASVPLGGNELLEISQLDGTTLISFQVSAQDLVELLITGESLSINEITYNPITSVTHGEGKVYYNSDDHALSLKTDIVSSTQSLGQEFWIRVINNSGSTIPNGTPVYFNGYDSTAQRPEIDIARADDPDKIDVLGFTTNSMDDGEEGWVTHIGVLNDLDTSGMTGGQTVYLGQTGGFTTTMPSVHAVVLGQVGIVSDTIGQIITYVARKEESILARADMYVSTAVASATVTPGTPISLLANSTTAAGDLSARDFTVGGSGVVTYTGTETKDFECFARFSISTGTSNRLVSTFIAVDGTAVVNSEIQRWVSTAGDVGYSTTSWSVTLSTGQYVEVFVDADLATTVTPERCRFMIREEQ